MRKSDGERLTEFGSSAVELLDWLLLPLSSEELEELEELDELEELEDWPLPLPWFCGKKTKTIATTIATTSTAARIAIKTMLLRFLGPKLLVFSGVAFWKGGVVCEEKDGVVLNGK